MPGAAPPATPEPGPQRADARRNREGILGAAREVFAQTGRDVQMPDVARAAGVGVGTLYRHFPAKEDLIRALVQDKVEAGIEAARNALAREDPWDAIEWLPPRRAPKKGRAPGACR